MSSPDLLCTSINRGSTTFLQQNRTKPFSGLSIIAGGAGETDFVPARTPSAAAIFPTLCFLGSASMNAIVPSSVVTVTFLLLREAQSMVRRFQKLGTKV